MTTDYGGVNSLSCLDCGTSTKFISSEGEAYFKLNHAGHRVVQEGTLSDGAPPSEAPPGDLTISQSGNGSEPHPPSGPTKRLGSFESMNPSVEPVRQPEPLEAPHRSHPKAAQPRRKDEEGAPKPKEESRPRPEAPNVAQQAANPPPRPKNEAGGVPQGASSRVMSPGEILLARTSYIEDTAAAEMEARRVSKALKQFRWNITPPYTISMIFSDILCITSESGSIPKALIDKVEELGYAFSGFEANNSRPLAWFKRTVELLPEPEPEPESPPEAEAQAEDAELRELVQTIHDQGEMIEKEMARLDEERKEIAEDLKNLSPAEDSEQK